MPKPIKLFTIGDSISQGFMSMAAARTDLSYSSLIASVLGQTDTADGGRQSPTWPKGGHPIDLERVMRRLARDHGSDIRGFEWVIAAKTIADVLDDIEDYYERGDGDESSPHAGGAKYFYNVAVRGFDVADAWALTPKICKQEIAKANKKNGNDNSFQLPNASFYRTALRVLNPSLDPQHDDKSQIAWLAHHAETRGVENLILWLGSNNALGTVLSLDISQTLNDPNNRPADISHVERARAGWNLWHPEDFAHEYHALLDRVDDALKKNKVKNCNIFVGTVPAVTVAPLAKGVGQTFKIKRSGGYANLVNREYTYFKYYTYFPFEEDFAKRTGKHLTGQEAVHIDDIIRQYNETIATAVSKRKRHHLIDIATHQDDLAWKRNGGFPKYVMPKAFDFLYPPVNTKYYHADSRGRLRQGGIFSLDGVHPSAIGQGLVAWEFLKAMQGAKVVADADGALDWPLIIKRDTLYSNPVPLMQEIYQHGELANRIVDFIRFLRD